MESKEALSFWGLNLLQKAQPNPLTTKMGFDLLNFSSNFQSLNFKNNECLKTSHVTFKKTF